MDYRYWRKLREKLKNYLGGTKSKDSMLKQYERELLELKIEGDYETSYPIKYYIDVAAKSVDLLTQCHITKEHLTTVYIDYLTFVRTCLKEDRHPTKEEADYFKNLDLKKSGSEDEEEDISAEKKPVKSSQKGAAFSNEKFVKAVNIRKPKKG